MKNQSMLLRMASTILGFYNLEQFHQPHCNLQLSPGTQNSERLRYG